MAVVSLRRSMKLNYKRKKLSLKIIKLGEQVKIYQSFDILCRKIRSDLKKLLSKLGYYKV